MSQSGHYLPPELIYEFVKFLPLKCAAGRSAVILHQLRPEEPFQCFYVKELRKKAPTFWSKNEWTENDNILDDVQNHKLKINGETYDKQMTIRAIHSPPLLDSFFVTEFQIGVLWAGAYEYCWMGVGFCFGESFVINKRVGDFEYSFGYGSDGRWIRLRNDGGWKFGAKDMVTCGINPMKRIAILKLNGIQIGKWINLEWDLNLNLATPALSFASKRHALWASVRYRFYMDENF